MNLYSLTHRQSPVSARILCRLATLTAIMLLPFSAISKTPLQKRIMESLDRNNVREALRLVDSARYDLRKLIDNRLSLAEFVMMSDSSYVVDSFLNRLRTVKGEEFFAAAALGNAKVFRMVLDRTSLTNLEIFEEGQYLLEPLTDSVRRALRKAFIASPMDQDAIDELTEMPKADPDLGSLRAWAGKMEMINREHAEKFLLATAVKYELERSTPGSRYLLANYLFPSAGSLGNDFDRKLFAGAFEKGRWDIVDALFRRGAKTEWLLQVDVEDIADGRRALGYFVKSQLLDTAKNDAALQNNRKWKIPQPEIYMPGSTPGKDFREKAAFPPAYVNTMGAMLIVEGRCGPQISLSMDLPGGSGHMSFTEVHHSINLKKKETFYMKPNPWGYRITIPGADTAGMGEYASVTVKNTGGYRQPIFDLVAQVMVVRDSVVIDTVRGGEELIINRALGPVWVCIPMAPYLTFGTEITFHQEQHEKLGSVTLQDRLAAYQRLLEGMTEGRTLERGTAPAFDAILRRHLVSEQLHESARPAIRTELISALRQLAAQSTEVADLSDYLYRQVTDTLATAGAPPGAAASVAQVAERIGSSGDRRHASLDLMEQPGVQKYINLLRAAEGLVWEFSQYYPAAQLKKELTAILSELSAAERQGIAANIGRSAHILGTTPATMNNKGAIITEILNPAHE